MVIVLFTMNNSNCIFIEDLLILQNDNYSNLNHYIKIFSFYISLNLIYYRFCSKVGILTNNEKLAVM